MGIRLYDSSCNGRLEHIILLCSLFYIDSENFLVNSFFSNLVSFFFFLRTPSLKSHGLSLKPVFERLLIIHSLEVSGLTLIKIETIKVHTLHDFLKN